MSGTMIRCGLWTVTAAALLLGVPQRGAAQDKGAKRGNGIIETADGPVRGVEQDGVRRFLGIPYAAPPVGDLRWRPPQPPAKWVTPLDAVVFGHTCVQTNTLGVFAAPSDQEDCLYLNVFTPANERGQQTRSVMVWIHGGGLFDGESNDYDASKLVRDGDVVVVTINYRLNIFGFLAHPALDWEGHPFGNYGLMDQQFALKWVQRNIHAFGGDPNKVTIFGESAGGFSVLANMASPTARGLFHRGIVESGAYTITALGQPQLLQSAEEYGEQFAAAVGCPDQTATCLRSLSAQAIIDRGSAYTGTAIPMVDGTILPQTVTDALRFGQFNRVPVINGTTRDELTWFVGITELATGHVLTAADYPAVITQLVGAANAPLALARYPLTAYDSPSLAYAAAFTDQLMACPARRLDRMLAPHVRTFGFEFADRTAPFYFPAASFPYGAAHTLEIQYLFPLYHGGQGVARPLNQAQERLSDQMVSYWTRFAETGNPSSHDAPDWPRYKMQNEELQSLRLPNAVTISAEEFAYDHKCDLWDALE